MSARKPANVKEEKLRKVLNLAMHNPDELVVEFEYRDRHGNTTRRVVSPIRFAGKDRFLALCLSREEPRMFVTGYCDGIRLRRACDYLMPVEMPSMEESSVVTAV